MIQQVAELFLFPPVKKKMEKQLLNIDELCEYIGMKKKTIYDLVYHDKIPRTKIGRCLRFPKDKIDIWIKNQTHVPQNMKILYNPNDELVRDEEMLK